ncbi:MAG: PAS domain-containing protein [Oleiphilus sp.]
MRDINDLNLLKFLESAHIGIVIHRWDTSIVYANPTALELLRLSYKQIIGKDAKDPQWNIIDEDHQRLKVDEYPVNKAKNNPEPLRNEVVGLVDSSSPTITWLMVNAYTEYESENDEGFIVVTFNDISDEKKQFSFAKLMENTQDIVIVTEAENIDAPLGPRIIYVNTAFEKTTGYSVDEVIGETPRILQGSMTDKSALHRIRQAMLNKKSITETVLNYTKLGVPYWLEMNIFPLLNNYGDVTHFAAIERDVTKQRFYQDQLEKRNQDLKDVKENLESLVEERTKKLRVLNDKLGRMAFYDQLTEIPNRRYFMEQAERLFSYY